LIVKNFKIIGLNLKIINYHKYLKIIISNKI